MGKNFSLKSSSNDPSPAPFLTFVRKDFFKKSFFVVGFEPQIYFVDYKIKFLSSLFVLNL